MNWHLRTVFDTQTHSPAHPGSSFHSQSQMRWQISRLMLLGGRGVGVPHLFSKLYPKTGTCTPHAHTHTHTSHILYVRCLRLRTHTPLTSLSENPSTHTSAGIFFHSSPSPIPPSPSLSPPSLSSLTANQAGGDIMLLQPVWRQEDECVCVMGEKGRHTQTPQEY